MSIDGLDFRLCNTVTEENTMDATLDLSDHLGGLVLKEEQKLAVEALLSGKAVKKIINKIAAAFQLLCATFLITLRVIASSMCFTLVPEEKLRISSTFKDFGC